MDNNDKAEDVLYTVKIENIVDKIIDDLTDRGGLGNEWDQIDEDIQAEIKEEWVNIIKDSLKAL